MGQFTIQELKWLDQVLRRDIDNTHAILSDCGDPPQYMEIIRLDMANKEALRAKDNQTMERMKRRAGHSR
jgi:hypothetical protein